MFINCWETGSAFSHIREDFNKQYKVTFEYLYDMVDQLREIGTRIPLYRQSTEMEPTESYTDQHS